ncbi:methyltransferase domain-containing protein [Skermania piniformis]|uniref:Methyltransferase domain-containing protein n=1 Tax=Skermania pinensis TaxID=39122 RepID=A0ABX8SC17_9ACTN|nr:methyltransferase domain-containing protein [Skermania piniformis]QXQ14135.1 methyltransferase domain-containing protein [Skermania piniformis]
MTEQLATQVDRIDKLDVDRVIDVLDMQAALPGLHRLRTWADAALAVSPGEHVVDIGSHTGAQVIALADAVGPTGAAIGVEPNPGLLAAAERDAAQAGSTARFVPGDAYGLPFGAERFDVVRCERVFQHLTSPARAAREIARVLRPGGRTMVIDSDWGTAIMYPGEPEVMRAITETMRAHTPNPYSGRRLPGLLTQAGLEVADIGSQALIQHRSVGSGPLIQLLTDRAVARGSITDRQRTSLLADLTAGARTGDFHMSVTMFAVLAHKPGR